MLNKPPVNVIVFGLPGSGKTFFAEKLAARINGLLISSDTIRQSLQQPDKYQQQAKMEVYQEMLHLMEKAARNKQDTVLDATFYKSAIRNLFKKKTRQLNSPLKFIEIRANESIIRERVNKKRENSDADFKIYLQIKSAFEPLIEDHLILYSRNEGLNEMLKKAIAYINYPDGTI